MAVQTPSANKEQKVKTKLDQEKEETLKRAEETSEKVKEKAANAAAEVKAKAEEAVETVQERAHEATEQVKAQGRDYADRQKQSVVSEVSACSSALRRAGERLNSESESGLGCYAHAAAEQLERLQQGLEQKSVTDLVKDVETQVRKRPELFFGTAFVVGLGLARFLKASNRSADSLEDESMGSETTRPLNGPSHYSRPTSPSSTIVDDPNYFPGKGKPK